MPFGPVTLATSETADVSAPGAVGVVDIMQISNSQLIVKCALPSADADGSPLTGLVRVVVAGAMLNDLGLNPFENLSMDQALAVAASSTTLNLTPEMAGTVVEVTVPVLVVGAVHAFAVAASD
jgi:hypothetical protein